MGIATLKPVSADRLSRRDTAVSVGAYAAGALAALAAVAIAVALIAFGWRDFVWVLAVRGPQGVTNALGMTALIVLISLPLTFVASLFAAACVAETSIGGVVGKSLRELLEWSSGIPPIVVGIAVFYTAMALRSQDAVAAAVAALVLLNLPRTTARLAQVFGSVPLELKETAAALGASPVTSFFGLVRQSTKWALGVSLFALAGLMIGETSALAVAMGTRVGSEPLSVQIWHFASNVSLARNEAASCLVLVLAVAACAALARACERKHVEASAKAL